MFHSGILYSYALRPGENENGCANRHQVIGTIKTRASVEYCSGLGNVWLPDGDRA
jgi:hypothetical protein